MLVAGEASGDLLAAELVQAIRGELAAVPAAPVNDGQPLNTSLEPRFFGAGGPRMAAAGTQISLEMTAHSVIGLSDVLRNLLTFRRMFHQLLALAQRNLPEVVVCVDFSGFNRRLAHAIRRRSKASRGMFSNWQPRIVQYVSPQVWASRERRVAGMAEDYDLLLSIIPFERDWYAARAPGLRVEFVGNPMVDRYSGVSAPKAARSATPEIVLLPGSRSGELRRHLPIIAEAARQIRAKCEARFRMVLPDESLRQSANSSAGRRRRRPHSGWPPVRSPGRRRSGHHQIRDSDSGMRVLWCARGRVLCDVKAHVRNWQASGKSALPGHAKPAGERDSLS